MKTFKKQPSERFDYDIKYSAWLPASDVLLSPSTITVKDISDTLEPSVPVDTPVPLLTADTPITYVGEKLVKVWIQGGTSGHTYKVSMITETQAGRRDEVDFLMEILEI